MVYIEFGGFSLSFSFSTYSTSRSQPKHTSTALPWSDYQLASFQADPRRFSRSSGGVCCIFGSVDPLWIPGFEFRHYRASKIRVPSGCPIERSTLLEPVMNWSFAGRKPKLNWGRLVQGESLACIKWMRWSDVNCFSFILSSTDWSMVTENDRSIQYCTVQNNECV